MNNYTFLSLSLVLLIACNQAKQNPPALFQSLPSEKTGITFNNEIIENDSFNILIREFMYNGGGVGVADFNQDGLLDIYLTGNIVASKLYLNKGNFEFEDISKTADVEAADIWSSGVSILDINEDNLPDIYVSATFTNDVKSRTNQLFINQGNNTEGIPTFLEQGAKYGLADTSHTTQTYFFDYDKDGDLDAFLLNNKLFSPRSTTDLNQLMEGGEATIDKLFRNNGKGYFEDVSSQAGITFPGFGLGAALMDINADGWLDIYVSNDFISNDLLYVNQRDGTFKNEVSAYFKHHSFSSMGIDVADLNDDGLEEVMTLDMLPEDESRVKRTYAFQKYKFYDLMEATGYSMQYNRNMLQLSDEQGRYSDISAFAGVDATEWSWSVLFADLDNDALRDIAITNGYPRDITDMDFTDYSTGIKSIMDTKSKLLAQIPVVKVRNYFYQNAGNLQFKDQSEAWGIQATTFSNGAAIADLDNDGDLDYIVNNINDFAQIYENKSNALNANNYLRIQLKGGAGNRQAVGAKVSVFWKDGRKTALNIVQRGYLSSIEPFLHFGLGAAEIVDSIRVNWPDGSHSLLKNITANQVLLIEKDKISFTNAIQSMDKKQVLFEAANIPELDFKHSEVKFFDFNFQVLLPRLHSREGPGIAVGDLNGDSVEDLAIGNGSRSQTHLYLSKKDGSFAQSILGDTPLSEDTGLLIFDADLDGDNDLYVASGSTEFRNGSGYYQDKFYKNEGNGKLVLSTESLPKLPISTASVSAADYDKDGDLDLFIAGRIEPQKYPLPASSFLLKNDKGHFQVANASDMPESEKIGMVNQGLWTDFNADGWQDLILVGEWMPICLFENKNGKLNQNPVFEIPNSTGWWNSITGADLDNDGDIDYVLGNQGLNNKVKPSAAHPLLIYAHDFDQNGSIDPIIAAYQEGAYYPVHLKMDISGQLNFLKKKFLKYKEYSIAKMTDLLPKDTLDTALKFKAETFESAILWNQNGTFRLEALPIEAQFAPIYGSLCEDVDLDGDLDILLVGNRYNTEVFEGRHDAFNGLVLINDGSGKFTKASQSGFVVDKDARSLIQFFDKNEQAYTIAGINDQPLKIFKNQAQMGSQLIRPKPTDHKVLIHFKNGQKQLRELYFGSSFLSQSSRNFLINTEIVRQIDFYDKDGVNKDKAIY